jgi:hypothetical protein
MCRFRLCVMAFAASLVLVAAVGARAEIVTITLHETGFADLSFAAPGSTGTPGTIAFGNFSVNITASDAASNVSTARLSTTNISVQDTDSAAHELTITTTATPFVFPGGDPLFLQSSLSDSFLSAGAPLDYTSFLNGPPGGTSSALLSLIGADGTAQAVTAPTVSGPRGGGTFGLGSIMDVTLAGGQSVSAVGSTSAVPEPSRVIALVGLAGMLGLGLVWQARRSSSL